MASCRRLDARGVVSGLMVIVNGLAVNLTGKKLPLPFRDGRTESFQTTRAMTKLLQRIGFEDVEVDQGKFFTVTATKSQRPQ